MAPQGDGSTGRSPTPPRRGRRPDATGDTRREGRDGGARGEQGADRSARSSPRSSRGRDVPLSVRSRTRSSGSPGPPEKPEDVPGSRARRRDDFSAERRTTAVVVPDDVTGRELDAEVRRQLRTLPTDLATKVARHLVMAGRVLDEDPSAAYRHAAEARRLASRVPAVREAAGLSAYAAGRYAEALTELRAATRMSGRSDLLPLIADAERGVGRPERALSIAASDEARALSVDGRVEMAIVASGARRDLSQPDAAVVALQIPELRGGQRQPWFARLAYAYAEALDAVGRWEEALTWLRRAVDADPEGLTGAAEWWDELHGVTVLEEPDE